MGRCWLGGSEQRLGDFCFCLARKFTLLLVSVDECMG